MGIKWLDVTALVITIIGAINWGLIGLFADNLSYLDRLVTPVPLYNKEPETFNDIEKIGCAFLTRVLLYTGRLVYNHSVN